MTLTTVQKKIIKLYKEQQYSSLPSLGNTINTPKNTLKKLGKSDGNSTSSADVLLNYIALPQVLIERTNKVAQTLKISSPK